MEWDWYLGEPKGQQLFWLWSPTPANGAQGGWVVLQDYSPPASYAWDTSALLPNTSCSRNGASRIIVNQMKNVAKKAAHA